MKSSSNQHLIQQVTFVLLLLACISTSIAISSVSTAGANPLPIAVSPKIVQGVPAKVSLPSSLLEMAMDASDSASQNFRQNHQFMGVIDYSLPSTAKRFWLVNRRTHRVELTELIAHGRGSGDNHAQAFSNEMGSLKSSLGLFSTGNPYWGQHGYSLRLHGLEPGINDAAFDRAIVLHGADYVSESFINRWHRLGRSFGCPALPHSSVTNVINKLKDGAPLFAYYPDSVWLSKSPYLRGYREKRQKGN